MRSQNNLLFQIACGFFLYSVGASKKIIEQLSRWGLCPSYASVHRAHVALANGQIRRAQLAVRSVPFGGGWDNTQISISVHVEQRTGTKAQSRVQTGTTAIVYELRNAKLEHMKLTPILERRALCDMITFAEHIRPTQSQSRDIIKHLTIGIVEILINFQPGLEHLRDSPLLKRRQYRPPTPKNKNKEYVLRTTTIDEGSTEGTVEVIGNIFSTQLDFELHELDDYAVPIYGDQKTNALARAAQILRDGDVSSITRCTTGEIGPGHFHVQMNDNWSNLKIHRGASNELGSLQYYIAILGKVRMNNEQPEYETLRSFTTQVLSGSILHLWEIEAGMSLKSFVASKPSDKKLLEIASNIYDKYVKEGALQHPEVIKISKTDNTFRNAVLLNRDLLLFSELCLSISSGDYGRVEIMLGILTMKFTGAGCRNYTTELLYFIQNLNKVWGAEFA